jgi:hypothetical protein
MRRSPVRLPLCVLIISRAGPRVPEEYGGIGWYKVAPIRDPGLDWEQTSKNVSLAAKTYKRESQVIKDQEGRAGEKERGLRGTKAGTVGQAGCPFHR